MHRLVLLVVTRPGSCPSPSLLFSFASAAGVAVEARWALPSLTDGIMPN